MPKIYNVNESSTFGLGELQGKKRHTINYAIKKGGTYTIKMKKLELTEFSPMWLFLFEIYWKFMG